MHAEELVSAVAKAPPAPPPEVLARLRKEIGEVPKGPAPWTRKKRLAWSLLLGTGALFASSPSLFRALSQSHSPVVFLPGLFAALGFVLLAPGTPFDGRSRKRGAFLLLGLVLLSLLANVEFFSLAHFTSPKNHSGCLPHSLFTGTLVTAFVFALWRRTEPFSPSWLGALVGGVGGAAGALAVSLSCSSPEGLHILIGHGLATLVLTIVGGIAGRRWLSP